MLKGNKELEKMTRTELIKKLKDLQSELLKAQVDLAGNIGESVKNEKDLRMQLDQMTRFNHTKWEQLKNIKSSVETVRNLKYGDFEHFDPNAKNEGWLAGSEAEEFRFLSRLIDLADA